MLHYPGRYPVALLLTSDAELDWDFKHSWTVAESVRKRSFESNTETFIEDSYLANTILLCVVGRQVPEIKYGLPLGEKTLRDSSEKTSS